MENNLQKLKEVNIPLTPNYKLTWIGFSEEGLILSQDGNGVIRGLFDETWVQIIDNDKNKKIWMFGMSDYKILGVHLGTNELEPSVFPRS